MAPFVFSVWKFSIVRRRDLNNKTIQPNPQDTDDLAGKPSHQSTKIHLPSRNVLVGELVLLMVAITVPFSVQAGFFAKLFGSTSLSEETQTASAVEAIDMPLLSALQNPDPLAGRGGAEIIVDETVLVSTGPVGEDIIAEMKSNSGEIRVHVVRPGETLSEIAEMFGVTTNTILWANDISKASNIQPGDSLVILPIVGVRHIVKSGETPSSIAKKYQSDVDEILSYNQIASAEELSVGDTLIIPGGAVHAAPVRVAAAQPVRVTSNSSVSTAGFSHPAPGAVRTQGIHGYNGVDLASSHGSAIRAAAAGEVIVAKSSGWNGGYGLYVVIRHPNGTQTLYAHLSSINVGVGQYVSSGQLIGGMGNTGRSTGTHLHFEVRGGKNPF